MIGEKELRILEELEFPRSRQMLAENLDYSPGTITNALGELEELGLVSRDKSGNEVIVHPVDARCVEVYHSLTKTNPHIDFPDLLTESMLKLLYYLDSDEPKPTATLIDKSGVPKSTVYRNLKTLTNRAIAIKDHSRYRLAEDFEELHTFAYELQHHLHRTRVKRDTKGGTLIWEAIDEFLVRTDEPVEHPNYHRTGLDAFAEYGLEFLTTSEHYYYFDPTRERLNPEDLACQLLLIENGARYRKYALLLIAATEPTKEDLIDRAEYYELDDVIRVLFEYLKSRGEVDSSLVPPWKEMKSLASDYGVEL